MQHGTTMEKKDLYIYIYIYIYIDTYIELLITSRYCTRYPFVPNKPLHAQSGRRTSFGIWMWFFESHTVSLFVCLFISLFVFEVKVYSYPVKQTKSYSTKRTENNRRFPP